MSSCSYPVVVGGIEMAETAPVLLQMTGISKQFPGVKALQHVDLQVRAGECLALVGENGAGKSTLMKILSGVYSPDEGTIAIDGQIVEPRNPHHAQELGVSIIYQEFNLFPNMAVEDNIFIGREPNRSGMVDRGRMRALAQDYLRQVGVDLDPRIEVRNLSVAQQQMVEIAKALSYNARIVIMDEPTSALTDNEVRALFEIIRSLKERGLAIVFVSHRLEEVFEICDRITVLRDGQNAGELDTATSSPEEVVRMMVGREIGDLYQKQASTARDNAVLEVRGLSRKGTQQDDARVVLDGIDLQVRAGEIVGLAGLVGSGRTEVARAIFGADPFDRGEILLEGQPVTIHSPADAIKRGIALAPEDRKLQALVLALAIRENISLPNLGRLTSFGFVRRREERALAQRYIEALSVRTPSMEQKVVNLSGGNQQKVVLAKWLALNPKVL
ncbi:MAG: sugar ABC transporter ATP-binding protein, partial [Thermomicrobiales bacterium]|nr:sugar ABC transporter ATP-binding protein [Thermomicrobiales bacterium]